MNDPEQTQKDLLDKAIDESPKKPRPECKSTAQELASKYRFLTKDATGDMMIPVAELKVILEAV